MLGQEEYEKRWQRKLKFFAANKVERWSPSNPKGRLIVTEDAPDGGLDTKAIP